MLFSDCVRKIAKKCIIVDDDGKEKEDCKERGRLDRPNKGNGGEGKRQKLENPNRKTTVKSRFIDKVVAFSRRLRVG